MTGWARRRFWAEVQVVPAPGGFAVHLDARPLRTPARAPLVLPARPLAEAVAEEWAGQGQVIAPETMPLTRAANSALDTVVPNRAAVEAELAGFGETDLLCYRAPGPTSLVARQAAEWDPLLDWAATALGARLVPVSGVMFAPQPAESLAALRGVLGRFDAFGLTALSDLVALSGSLVIGLAAATGHRPAAALWQATRIDEDWQAEQWGTDAEAAAQAGARRAAFLQAARLIALCADGHDPATPAREAR